VGAHLRVCGFIPSHFPTLSGEWNVTPGLPSWPTHLQALTLVANPRIGLRQNGSIINHNPNEFVMHIMWRITRHNNHVGLLPLFQGMAYGLSYTTIYEGSNKKLVVSTMHQLYLFCYFVLGFNIKTYTCSWLGQWMIKEG
jgi:hypothetical protein